jgi:hypothetical protein
VNANVCGRQALSSTVRGDLVEFLDQGLLFSRQVEVAKYDCFASCFARNLYAKSLALGQNEVFQKASLRKKI